MKKLLLFLLLLLPLSASATTVVPWQQTNLTDGFIAPALVNGVKQGIIVSASSTIFNLSSNTSTSTNATSTNLYISNNASTTNFFTNTFFAGGLVTCNTGGSSALTWSGGQFGCNTISGGGGSSYPFPLSGNATSTLTQFNGGLTAFASSTIGDTTQAGGLTISGGATTTGNAYFASNVGIGTTSPLAQLSISNFNGGNTDQFVVASSSNSLATTTSLIVNQYGNVGIGTVSPGAKLDVAGTTGEIARFASGGGVSDSNYITLGGTRTMFGYNGVTANAVIQGIANKGIEFNVNNNTFGLGTVMTILQSGNVGIGTVSPNFTLEVSGTASTTQLFATKGTFSFASTTNLLATASSTLQNFTFVNATGTNATTTAFFATNGTFTTASSTNLFATNATFGTFSSNLATFLNLLVNGSTTLQNFTFVNATGTNATTTNFFSTTGTLTTASSTNNFATSYTGGLATFNGLLLNASSTFQNFTGVNSTTTNATTTTLNISGNSMTISSLGGFINATTTASVNLASTTLDALGKSMNIATSTFLLRNNPTGIKLLGFYCTASTTGTVGVDFSHDNGNVTQYAVCTSGSYTIVSSNNTWTPFEDFNVQASSTAGTTNRVTITAETIATNP